MAQNAALVRRIVEMEDYIYDARVPSIVEALKELQGQKADLPGMKALIFLLARRCYNAELAFVCLEGRKMRDGKLSVFELDVGLRMGLLIPYEGVTGIC